MLLKAITNGSVTSTGTVECPSYILGGVLITTDNSNAVTVIINRVNSSGKEIMQIVTKTTMWITGPFSMEDTTALYYSVTGTGGAAQLYEWVP